MDEVGLRRQLYDALEDFVQRCGTQRILLRGFEIFGVMVLSKIIPRIRSHEHLSSNISSLNNDIYVKKLSIKVRNRTSFTDLLNFNIYH